MYNTSKKAKLQKHDFFNNWLQKNTQRTKYLGLIILLITLILSIIGFGLTSGILFWLFTVTLLLSLLIILYPLNIFSIKKINILFAILVVLELILNL